MLVLLFFLLAAMALALPFPQRRIAPKAVYVPVGNSGYVYYVNVTVGTPPQPASLFIDTGSDLTWIDDKSTHCLPGSSPASCADNLALFDPAQSDSYTLLNQSAFDDWFADFDRVRGDYFTDKFGIGSLAVSSAQKPFSLQGYTMGLAKTGTYHPGKYGMIGLSPRFPSDLPPGAVHKDNPGSAEMLALMKQQDIIRTRSFSMSLGHREAHSGSLLFGAYDPSKFEGSLAVVPMQKDSDFDRFMDYQVNVSSVALTDSRGTTKRITPTTFNSIAMLDSGTVMSILSKDLYRALVEATGAHYIPSKADGRLWLDCKKIPVGSMNFEFGNLGERSQIAVKLADFFAPGQEPEADGSTLCEFSANDEAHDDTLALNQSFMRSAYIVHHLDEKVIGLAQAKDVDQGVGSFEDVVEIKPGDSMFRLE
ncbi:hypothetical protein LTR12_010167 [Friedmanniomyces endolithicus]|nr:hypothetical protein LTR74_002108 [Friedmanniomyces endolithicus]KAK1815449.1 hypothetical protein LTR12_010167 [Friedmanniomyces endolithicus]